MTLPDTLRASLEHLLALPPRLEARRFLVAVSGGRDSVALLHLCVAAGLSVVVAHLDHGLREASGADATFVRDLAASLGLEFVSERVDVATIAARRGLGLEEAARRVRYDFLSRAAKAGACDAMLTAHTLEDNAETVLLQLLRGTARATGIPARRARVLRPLLTVSRHDLETFLKERGLPWREDASNADERFTRNWVRHSVLPLLESRFAAVTHALSRYAAASSAEDALLERLAASVPDWADWRAEPEAVQRRLVRRTLEAAGVAPDFAHLSAIQEALVSRSVQRFSLSRGRTGVVQAGKLRVFSETDQPVLLEWPEEVDFSGFPWAKLRTRAPGDRIRLSGGTRKLSDVLIDRKVPKEVRDSIPIVAQNGEVLWVGLEPPVLDVRLGVTADAELLAMKHALELAREALEAGEVPVGAVVIRPSESSPLFSALDVVGQGRNRSKEHGDMTRHAELEAIRAACQKLERAHLTDCTLIVTLEPCPMCLGAALEARLGRIVFAARNSKNGALGGVTDLSRAAWNHRFSVRSGPLEREASALLSAFFAGLRGEAR